MNAGIICKSLVFARKLHLVADRRAPHQVPEQQRDRRGNENRSREIGKIDHARKRERIVDLRRARRDTALGGLQRSI